MVQCMNERGVGLAVISEPYNVPNHPQWFGDRTGSVCITYRNAENHLPCSLVEQGDGFVVVRWGELYVASCYLSPARTLASFEVFLDKLGESVRGHANVQLLVLGDFNAKSTAWGNPRNDVRGNTLASWAAGLGLHLLNRGDTPTCSKWNGSSCIDTSWASPAAARRVSRWRVLDGSETLSDHAYIMLSLDEAPRVPPREPRVKDIRWVKERLSVDALMAAAVGATWTAQAERGQARENPDSEAERVRGILTSICDAAMPRGRSSHKRRVYWWSEDIAAIRAECEDARHQYQRARRLRNPDEDRVSRAHGKYKERKKALQKAIAKAKATAWTDLLRTLDKDPWGKPYKLVLEKLKPRDLPLTEKLGDDFVKKVVDKLFPKEEGNTTFSRDRELIEWSENLQVTAVELEVAVRKTGNKAPGLDGVPGKAFALASRVIGPNLRQLYDSCLSQGRFPSIWKTAKLVLLHKKGRPADSPAAYRPICLLDEIGKTFERIISARLVKHLESIGPNVSDSQFGFRGGRSTVSAIKKLREDVKCTTESGGMALAVSLDIVNAFNSIPWNKIGEAMEFHGFPEYLKAVVGDYLNERYIVYNGRDGKVTRRLERGVPQGSVLGPLLWNLAYDAVLRVTLPAGVSVICYADDTLIVSTGRDYVEVTNLAETGVKAVVDRIHALGLKIAAEKTEAMWFFKHTLRARRPPRLAWITVDDRLIRVKLEMKYLGLRLEHSWRWRRHFEEVAPKVARVAGALGRLLPNLHGPKQSIRRLYATTVNSVILYGSPIWAGDLERDKHCLKILHGKQRLTSLRVIRGYRTVSYGAAMLLAGNLPVELLAIELAEVYEKRENSLRGGWQPPDRVINAWRRQARDRSVERWKCIATEYSGESTVRVAEAVLPVLREWTSRTNGAHTFRMTQVMTGHGCFGAYLKRINKEPLEMCYDCGWGRDDATHVLEHCPAWAVQRSTLRREVGPDLSLPGIVRAISRGREEWEAFASFCEDVMSGKEASERERERDPLADRNAP